MAFRFGQLWPALARFAPRLNGGSSPACLLSERRKPLLINVIAFLQRFLKISARFRCNFFGSIKCYTMIAAQTAAADPISGFQPLIEGENDSFRHCLAAIVIKTVR